MSEQNREFDCVKVWSLVLESVQNREFYHVKFWSLELEQCRIVILC